MQEPERVRDDVTAEIAFADEQRNNENVFGGECGEHSFNLWLLFPKRFVDLGENLAAAQFGRVLVNRNGRVVVLGRAMSKYDEGGI